MLNIMNKPNPSLLLLAAGAAFGLPLVAAAQQVDSSWVSAATANWATPARWSTNPNIPNNGVPGGQTYRAIFAVNSAAYTITLNTNITVDQILLQASNATINHAGGTLTLVQSLNRTAGQYQLGGGTISGGTLNMGAGASLRLNVAATSTLSGVTLNGGINKISTASVDAVSLNLQNGCTINGAMNFGASAGVIRVRDGLALTGQATLGVGTTLLFDGAQAFNTGTINLANGTLSSLTPTVLTLGSAVTLNGPGTIAGDQLVSNALVIATGGVLTINPTSLSGNGTLRVVNGGTLNLFTGTSTAWGSVGTFSLQGGTLNLGGVFSSAELATIQRSGGVLQVSGTANNTGSAINLATIGNLELTGGTIRGGSVSTAPGGALTVIAGLNSRLDGVVVNGNLSTTGSSVATTLTLAGANSVTGDFTLGASQGTTRVTGSLAVGGTMRIGAASIISYQSATVLDNHRVQLSGGQIVSSGAPGQGVTLGSGSTITGNGAITGTGLTNNGLITASGGVLNIFSSSVSGAGDYAVTSGGTLNFLTGTVTPWTTPGAFVLSGGALDLGGSFASTVLAQVVRTGGQLLVSGTMNNSGQTLNLAAGPGSMTLRGSTITGGAIVAPAAAPLSVIVGSNTTLTGVLIQGNIGFSGTTALTTPTLRLNNCVVDGSLDLAALSGATTVVGSFSVTAGVTVRNGAMLDFQSGQTLSMPSLSLLGGVLTGSSATGLTISSSTTVSGGGEILGARLVNNGRVLANSGTLFVRPSALSGPGSFEVFSNGTLHLFTGTSTPWSPSGPIRLNGGSINLGGVFASSVIGGIERISGLINITGTANNANSSIVISPGTGPVSLVGGTIVGGLVSQQGGAPLIVSSVAGNRLLGVTVEGPLVIGSPFGPTANLRLRDSLTLNTAATLGFNSTLNLENATTISGGLINATSGMNTIGEFTPGSTLTFTSSSGLTAQSGAQVNVSARVVNNGQISAEGSGSRLSFNGTTFSNTGVIDARQGATVQIGSATTTWTNTGTIAAPGGTVVLTGTSLGAGLLSATTGGTIVFDSTISNANSVISVTGTPAALEVRNARFNGGIVNLPTGVPLRVVGPPLSAPGLILDDVTFNGDITLTRRLSLSNAAPGLELVKGAQLGTSTVRIEGQNCRVELSNRNGHEGGTDTLTVSGGTFLFDPYPAGPVTSFEVAEIQIDNNLTLTLSPTNTIRGGNFKFSSFNGNPNPSSRLIANGTIIADIEDAPITFRLANVINNGTIGAENFGVFDTTAATSFVHAGNLRIRDGIVNFGSIAGSVRIMPGSTLDRIGGQFNLMGTVENSGQLLDVAAQTGTINIVGTTRINGGTVRLTNPDSFTFNPTISSGPANLTFFNVALQGDLNILGPASTVSFAESLQTDGTIFVGHNGIFVSRTASGPCFVSGNIRFVNQGVSEGERTDFDGLNTLDGSILELTPTSVLSGGLATIGGRGARQPAVATVINRGLIRADVPGQRLTIFPRTFTNHGTLEARDGGWLAIGLNASAGSRWTNNGTIIAHQGSLIQLYNNGDFANNTNNGTITALPGGTIDMNGEFGTVLLNTIRNSGGNIVLHGIRDTGAPLTLNDNTGSFTLNGGNIDQCTLTTSGSAELIVLNANITRSSIGGTVRVLGQMYVNSPTGYTANTLISGPGAEVRFSSASQSPAITVPAGTFVFDNSASGARRILSGQPSFHQPQVLTFGPNVLIRGGNGNVRTNVATAIVNQGVIRADVAGESIVINTPQFTNEGVIEAINGGLIVYDPTLPVRRGDEPSTFASGGALRIGAASAIIFNGGADFESTSVLEFMLADSGGWAGYGHISASRFTLAGTFRVTSAGGFVPAIGELIRFIDAPSLTGQFASIELPILPADRWWDSSQLASHGTIAVIPAPTAAVVGAAATGLALLRRRRRALLGTGALGTVLGCGAGSLQAIPPLNPVLYPPQAVAGLAAGRTVAVVNDVLLSPTGDIGFTAKLTPLTGFNPTEQVVGYWRGATGARIVARSGDQPVGVNVHAFFDSVVGPDAFAPVSMSGTGGGSQLVFAARLTGINISSSNNVGFWLANDAGTTAMAARLGRPVEGVDRSIFLQTFPGAFTRRSRVNVDGRMAFLATVANPLVSPGIWTYDAVTGQALVALTGQARQDNPNLSIFDFQTDFQIAPDGRVLYRARVRHPQLVNSRAEAAIFLDDALLVRSNQQIPGGLPGQTFGDSDAPFEAPVVNRFGPAQIAFATTFIPGMPAPRVLLLDANGTLQLIYRSGDPAPGSPPGVTLGIPHVAAINDAGVAVIFAELNRGTCTTCATTALYTHNAGALQPAAFFPMTNIRNLPPAAALPRPATVSLNSSGQMVFDGPLTTGAFVNANSAFGWSAPRGGVFPITVAGDQVEVRPGIFRTVREARLMPGEGTVDGTAGSIPAISPDGRIALRLTFTDDTVGIFTSTFADVLNHAFPCPIDFSGDGMVDPDDLADYVSAFFSNPANERADYNLDGVVDPDDLSDFISAFFIGCT